MYSCVLQKPSWQSAALATPDSFSTCPAARGAGAALAWQLTVGGQTVIGGAGGGAGATQLLSYTAPVITGLSVAAVNGTALNASALGALDTRGCVPPAPCTAIIVSITYM